MPELSSVFLADESGTLKAVAQINSMDTLNARYWHTPRNEREYDRSPQRDLWRTAKELKMDEYMNLRMFDYIPITSVDRKQHRIYDTLWAYKIKLNADLTFNKLNPRWCVKGGTMDRDKFKAHAETLRMTSNRIISGLKAAYWEAFCTFLADCSNAFQATRTDGEFKKTSSKFFCWPAPGFHRTINGVKAVCEVNVGMQGRIDATLMFNTRLFALMLVKANVCRALWTCAQ